MHRSSTLALLLLAIPLPVTAQRQFVVDAAGRPGATHADIQSAIDAAGHGDRILVRADAGVVYAGFDLGKGVELIAAPGGRPAVAPSAVSSLPADRRCVVESLEFRFEPWTTPLRVANCLGSVVLRDLDLPAGPLSIDQPENRLEIQDSELVIVQQCRVGANFSGVCRVTRSTATFQETVLQGGTLAFVESAGPGLLAYASHGTLHDSSVTGGSGAAGFGDSFSGRCWREATPGAPAVFAQGSTVLATGEECRLMGGAGGPQRYPCTAGRGGYALVGSSFRVARGVSLLGGVAAPWTQLPRQPSLERVPLVQPLGVTADLQLRDEGPGAWGLFVDLQPGRFVLPGVEVPIQLGPTHLPILYGSLGVANPTTIPVALPSDPALVERLLWFQAGVLRTSSELLISNVGAMRVR